MTEPETTSIPHEPRWLRKRLWLIFLVTMAIYILPNPFPAGGHFLLTKSRADSWNDEARIATVESLTERGTLAIEYSKWGWFTGDKVLLREHFYSTKPPLLSVVGAFNYWVFRDVIHIFSGEWITYLKNEDIIYPWVTFTTSGLAFALLLVYFYRSLFLVELSNSARTWLFWALAIGTLYPAYSTVLNNHTISGTGIFIAFYYVMRHRLGVKLKIPEALFSGLSAGFAGVNDLSGALPFVLFFFLLIGLNDFPWAILKNKRAWAIIALLIFLIVLASAIPLVLLNLLSKPLAIGLFLAFNTGLAFSIILAINKRPATLCYFIGLLIPAVAHLFFNSRITGNWMPTYIQSDVYIATPPGYFGEVVSPSKAGILFWQRWVYAGTALFGIRGIFLYTPILLLGLGAAIMTALKKHDQLRWDALSAVIGVIAGWGWVLLFASPNFGGTSFGVRYALTATPILVFFCHKLYIPGSKPIWAAFMRNAILWGFIFGLIAIPWPWGMFGGLPSTQASFAGNLEYISLNFLSAAP